MTAEILFIFGLLWSKKEGRLIENLYYIENKGCDATTYGLVRISDEDFPKFKNFIENLNRNSTYQCMPVIRAFKIPEDAIEEVTDVDKSDPYISYLLSGDDSMYLDSKVYRLNDDYTTSGCFGTKKMECVIGEDDE